MPSPISTDPRRYNWDHPARMPQRFGVGLMLLFLSLFSVSFFLLQLFGVSPTVILYLALLFTAVSLAQMASPKRPRVGSSVAGAIFTNGWVAVYFALNAVGVSPTDNRLSDVLEAVVGTLCLSPFTTIWGGFCGYLMGALVAGIFLRVGLNSPLAVGDDPPVDPIAPQLWSQPDGVEPQNPR